MSTLPRIVLLLTIYSIACVGDDKPQMHPSFGRCFRGHGALNGSHQVPPMIPLWEHLDVRGRTKNFAAANPSAEGDFPLPEAAPVLGWVEGRARSLIRASRGASSQDPRVQRLLQTLHAIESIQRSVDLGGDGGLITYRRSLDVGLGACEALAPRPFTPEERRRAAEALTTIRRAPTRIIAFFGNRMNDPDEARDLQVFAIEIGADPERIVTQLESAARSASRGD